ncbi:MAG TPA: flagellar hook-length control protein FliK [Symbiobacteriaceae bacterium]|nr:flagellar hook-length control protein FliK [Symbiobacteriaceae bacterium]
MPMNPLPPTGGPGAAQAAPAGPGRKEEPGSPDSGFTALLMAMMGAAMVPMAPVTDQQAPAVDGEAVPAAAVPVPQMTAAPALPEQLETLLQAQRVTVTVPDGPAPALVNPQPQQPQAEEGAWVVEPLVVTAVTVQAPATGAESGPGQEAPAEEKAAPVLPEGAPKLDVPHFAAHTAAVHQTAGVAAADTPKTPAAIPSPIEPERLMDAIAKSAVSAADGRYTVTLRLHPEQLGEVRLQLHVAGREVQTTLQVANPEARQMLEQRSDQLRDGLNQSGLTLSGFHVATGQEERQRDAREQFEQLNPRRRGRQSGAVAPVGSLTARPARISGTRRTTGFDTLA